MTNDVNTLNGALQELGETMASNLQAKGVTASASDGLTTLAGKILTIPAGSCYHIEFSEDSYTAVGGSATLEIMLQENYQPKSGATVTVTGSDSSLYSGLTNNDGVAQVTVNNVSGTVTFTASYSNVSAQCTVVGSSVIWEDDFNRSTLGSDWVTFGTGANASISNNQLVLTRNGNGRGGIYYNQQVTGDYKITLDFANGDYDNVNLGIAISGTSWKCYEVEPKWYFGYITISSSGTISSSVHEQRTSGITSATIVYEVIQDTSIKMYINGTLKGTYNVQDGTTDGYIGVTQCCGRTSRYNSIKVEPL